MRTHRFRRGLLALVLLFGVLFVAACGQEQPTRWDDAQQNTEDQPATSEESLAGSDFNALFPDTEGSFDLVYTQEKTGFVEASLKKDGIEVALLSISDTVNNPDARQKFAESSEVLAGFPVADVGSKGTAVLVADRFQVQVRSVDDSFSRFDREDWLQKFDLDGLSQLAP